MYLDNQNWIINNIGSRGAYQACYPSGAYSPELIQILQSIGVLTGRTTNMGYETTPITNPDDFFELKVQSLSAYPSDLDSARESIAKAVADGSTVIFMIHKMTVSPQGDDLTTSILQTVVDLTKSYVDQGKLSVMTMSEWYNAAQ